MKSLQLVFSRWTQRIVVALSLLLTLRQRLNKLLQSSIPYCEFILRYDEGNFPGQRKSDDAAINEKHSAILLNSLYILRKL